MTYKPHSGPQTAFHESAAFEVLFGGSCGGGKTVSLLAESLRYVHYKGYAAMLFRRTVPQLTLPQGLVDQSMEMFGKEGQYNDLAKRWRFPNGSSISFGHMQYAADKQNYKGAQISFLGIDQVEDFDENMYIYLFSRVRSTAGCPRRIRVTANPPDDTVRYVADPTWIKRRWLPWLGSDEELEVARLPKTEPGDLLWYKRIDDKDTLVEPDTPGAMSRTCIPATVYDNPTLMRENPEYIAQLESLPLLERERLLHGNWNIVAAGNILKRKWFSQISDTFPDNLRWVRYWDLATSVRTSAHYTATCMAAFERETGNIYLRNMERWKQEWPDTKKAIIARILSEPDVECGIEAAMQGKSAVQELLRDERLVGSKIVTVEIDKDKVQRVNAWSPRAESGHIVLISGNWIPGFLSEAEVFDGKSATYDDQIDAVSGCVQMLAIPKWREMEYLHL